MNRPRGRGPGLDPETAARLQQLLSDTAPRPGGVRRPAGPPEPRQEIAYELQVGSAGSRPIVVVLERKVMPSGYADPWAWARITPKSVHRFADAVDRDVVSTLLEVTAQTASLRLTMDDAPTSRFALSRAACARIFPMLARTGRFHLRREPVNLPLRWIDDPFRLLLRVTDVPEAAEAWDVEGFLASGAHEIPLTRLDAFLDGNYAIAAGQLARVEDGGASSWMGMLLTHRRTRITPARRAAFLEEIFSLPAPPIALPAGFSLPETIARAEPRLVIHPPVAGTNGSLFAELSFTYDGVCVTARRPGKVAYDPARMRLVRRDPEAESAAATRVTAAGVEPIPKTLRDPPPEGAHLVIAPARLPAIVSALVAEGFRVEAGGKTYRKPKAWRASIKSGVDWLDVEGEVEFDGFTAPLPAVLEALRRGDDAVVLDDGTLGLLPEEWLSRHGFVLRLGAAHEGRVRFAQSQLPLLAALAAGEPRVVGDETFVRTRAALTLDGPVEPADPPANFKGSLRAYQREGLGWLTALARSGLGGLLADDMGLGKTVQVLALLAGRKGKPSLIVAPRSLVFNWKREAARFTPDLRVLDHTGGDRRPPGPHFRDHDLVVTTYGTLRRDAEALANIDFDYVVLDEAQAIKNDSSETARAARRLRSAQRLALSGTPVENHLGELWSIVEYLNPGMLGRAAAWKAVTDARPSPDAVALLGRALRPILLRRTKAEVAPDLPARMEETWVCELEGEDRALYDELRARLRAELLTRVRAEGMGSAGADVLTALLRLRQAACHPGLVDPSRKGSRSAKVDMLVAEITALRESGQKALVFSQFRSLLDLVRPHLEAEGITVAQLDGKTRDREALVQRFQDDPSLGVMLISLKAGGVGLNLTAAEYVFLLDPWWNPAAEAQAIDRAHRIGQTRAVFAYRLIAKDTVEERIAELQQRKRALAESVIRGDGAPLRELSVEDLDRLLS